MIQQEIPKLNLELEAAINQRIEVYNKLPESQKLKVSWLETKAPPGQCDSIVKNLWILEENSVEAPSSALDFEEVPFVS